MSKTRVMMFVSKTRSVVFVVLAVLAAACHCATVLSSTYNDPWVSSNDAGAQVITECSPAPCAQGSYEVNAAAARTGQWGLQVTVDRAGAQSWYIQVTVPKITLADAIEYKVCFWAKTDNAQAVGPTDISMDMLQWGTWAWLKGSQLRLTTAWTLYCMSAFRPQTSFQEAWDSKSAEYFWVVNLGTAPSGRYSFDDFTITSTPLSTDPSYLADAPKRIEAERKGNFTMVMLDKNGSPLPRSAIKSISITLKQHGFPFGTALDPEGADDASKPWYYAKTASMFNAIVPGFRFKWPDYEPERGSYSWAFDLLNSSFYLGFVDKSQLVLSRGHALEWLTEDYGFKEHWSRQDGCDKYRTYLKERILRDVSLFRGRFQAYDVWNELLHERAFIDKCDMWKDTVKDAFRWAAAADPDAQLCANEYGLLEGDDAQAMVDLVKGWLDEGVPVHCIGVQAHIKPDIPTEIIKLRLDTLATLGLPLYITEFDLVSGWGADGPYWSGSEQEQADAYKRYTQLFFAHPAVRGVMWWGWWDSDHWIKKGGIYTADKKPKAAAIMLNNLLYNTWSTDLSSKNPTLDKKGGLKFRGFYGTYQYSATLTDGTAISGTVAFPSPQPHINKVKATQSVTIHVVEYPK